ncbi:MAG TPA: two-component regulator propeller domain-containing protein, partial [bacterium]|nr:two-component regulator propeller domain-containing protein [bacterium]
GYEFLVFQHDENDSFSISHNYVTALLEDQDGRIWVGTEDGLNLFDPITGRFEKFFHDPMQPASISNNNINVLFQDSFGTLWIGTHVGLNKLRQSDEPNFERVLTISENKTSLPSNLIRAIGQVHNAGGSAEKKLWIGTTGGGLSVLDMETNTFSKPYDDLIVSKKFNMTTVWDVYEDPADRGNTLWVGTPSGLGKIDRATRQLHFFSFDNKNPNGISHNRVRRILRDSYGRLWVGTTEGGINLMTGDTFLNFRNTPNQPSLFTDEYIYDIYQSSDGIVWACTYSNGVTQISGMEPRFVHYKKNPLDSHSLIHNVVRSFTESGDGSIWISTDDGISRWDRNTDRFEHLRFIPDNPNALSDRQIHRVYEDRSGKIWIGTHQSGLQCYDPVRKTMKSFRRSTTQGQFAAIRVYDILEDENGYIWLATYRSGLIRYDPQNDQFKTYGLKKAGGQNIRKEMLTVLHRDNAGKLWIGTQQRGLLCFDRQSEQFTTFSKNTAEAFTISDNHVYSIYQDKSGYLWIGTANGLNRFDPLTQKFQRITRKDGLPNNVIYGIIGDEHDNLWLSSNRGIIRMQTKSDTSRVFTVYTSDDGLQADQFEPNACLRTREGEFLFGGVNGFNIFHPRAIVPHGQAPRLALTDFRLFDKPTKLDTSIPYKHDLHLNYDQNFFSFSFSALNFFVPEKNQYAYKLDGIDENWNFVTGKNRIVKYTDIDPGNYTLLVRASNHDQIWNNDGLRFPIVIRPPYWETWWFRTILFATLVGILVFAYTARVRNIEAMNRRLEGIVIERTAALNQKKDELQHAHDELEKRVEERTKQLRDLSDHLVRVREEERTRISREVHDELGQQLTALKMDLSWIQKRLPEDSSLKEKSNTMSSLIDATVKSVQRIASELRPGLLDDLGVSAAIEWQSSEFEKRTGIQCRCYLEQGDTAVTNEQGTALFRIFQETLTNVMRHAEATEVVIEFFAEHEHLHLIIRDNGKGITKVQLNSPHSLGLMGMRERIQHLQGEITISGEQGKGTVVHVSLPIINPIS